MQIRGVLQTRPVDAATVVPIGRESNRLNETQAGLFSRLDEVDETYDTYDREGSLWKELLRPALNRLIEDRSRREIAEVLRVFE